MRLFDGNTLRQTFIIPSAQASTPTSVNEGILVRSWNVTVPGSLIRPGLEVVADVDPSNAIAESNEGDNSFPASGARLQLQVRSAPRLNITLVPVRQSANGLEGDVTEATRLASWIRSSGCIRFPATTPTCTPSTPPRPGILCSRTTVTDAWNEVLNEILALQIAEGTGRNYYGVVRTGYPDGMNGNGFLGAPAAIGYDDPADAGRVAAHEMGHNWGRLHSACGSPGDVDPAYPVSRRDHRSLRTRRGGGAVKTPSQPDIMGYCGNPWISDYNYSAVMDFRGTALAVAGARRSATQPARLGPDRRGQADSRAGLPHRDSADAAAPGRNLLGRGLFGGRGPSVRLPVRGGAGGGRSSRRAPLRARDSAGRGRGGPALQPRLTGPGAQATRRARRAPWPAGPEAESCRAEAHRGQVSRSSGMPTRIR